MSLSLARRWQCFAEELAIHGLTKPFDRAFYTEDAITLRNGQRITMEAWAEGPNSRVFAGSEGQSAWWDAHGGLVLLAWSRWLTPIPIESPQEIPMSRSHAPTEALDAAQEACQACSELSLTIAYLQSQLKHTQSEVATLVQRIEAIERALPDPTSGYRIALEPE